VSADAVVAGRLEIPVESSTKGFKQRLKEAVDKASEGVEAKVGVDIEPKALRKRLKESVAEASKGVDAEVGVKIKTKGLKAKLEAAVKAAGPVNVDANLDRFGATVRQHLDKLAKETVTVGVTADEKGMNSLLARWRTKMKSGLSVPVGAPSLPGGGAGGGGAGGGSAFKMPSFGGGPSARSAFTPIMYAGIASVIQPAIAAVVGSLGSLVAMAGPVAASLNTLGGAGGAIGALASSMVVLQMSFGGLFGKLEKVPKDLMPIRKEFEKLRPEMESFTKIVRGSFWNEWKGDIEKTGKVVMPIFREGLAGVGKELGETAKQGAAWMRSPMFKKQTSSIFYTMRGVTDGIGAAFLGMARGMTNVTVAAGPMLGKFGDVLRNFGKWSAGIGDTAGEQKKLASAFEYGWQKARQLWDMTKNLGAALKGVFGAGKASGDRLLGSLQGVIREWRTWSESAAGQNRMKEWFDAVEPIAREVGKLIVDIGKALGRLSEDSTTAGLIGKIRTELLPSLETFLRNLGTTLGPAVITFITNVLEVLTQMSAAGSPLGQGLTVISELVGGLADIFRANPELAKNVGILLGALLGFRALTFFGSLIPGIAGLFKIIKGGGPVAFAGAAGGIALFSGALSGLPGPVQGAVAALSTLLTIIPSIKNFKPGSGISNMATHIGLMGVAFGDAKGKAGGFSGAMKGVAGSLGYGAGAVGGGLKGALKGALGMLGGPWGIALVGASAAIGGYMQAQENANAAAQAFSDTLDKQTGKLTKQSGDFAIKNLMDNISGEDIDRLDRLGISIGEAANAVTQGGPQLDAFRKKVTDLSTAQGPNLSQWGGEANDNRDALDGLNSALGHLNTEVTRGKKINADYAKGQQDAANASTTFGDKMRALIPTATEVADALDRIAGITLSKREADRRAAESTEALNAAIKENGKAHGAATAAGRANDAALDSYAQAQVAAAKANAESGASAATLRDQLEKARAKIIASAKAMGYSQTEAEKLATDMGLTGAAAEGMAAKVDKIKGKTVIVKVTDQASAVAAAAQRAIDSVTGKTVTITSVFQTQGYQASLRAAQAVRHAATYFGEADGGIIRHFADGGVTRAIGRKIKQFANGAERHIAQIARGGEYRVWAEDETGGEAYIPLAPGKRGRSMEILRQVADEFGMALTPALSGAASAAGAAYASNSSSRRGLSDRPAATGGPRVVIEPGGVIVNNPAPEPTSKSVVDAVRSVGANGLFGGDEEF